MREKPTGEWEVQEVTYRWGGGAGGYGGRPQRRLGPQCRLAGWQGLPSECEGSGGFAAPGVCAANSLVLDKG